MSVDFGSLPPVAAVIDGAVLVDVNEDGSAKVRVLYPRGGHVYFAHALPLHTAQWLAHQLRAVIAA